MDPYLSSAGLRSAASVQSLATLFSTPLTKPQQYPRSIGLCKPAQDGGQASGHDEVRRTQELRSSLVPGSPGSESLSWPLAWGRALHGTASDFGGVRTAVADGDYGTPARIATQRQSAFARPIRGGKRPRNDRQRLASLVGGGENALTEEG